MTMEHSGSGDLNRSLELLWDFADKPGRGRKPGLTLDRIVTAAVAIADADGLEAVSMRRISGELGVGAMSLYRYVPGKAELLDLMLDSVCVVPQADPATDWRTAVEQYARANMDLYLRHPWMLQVDQARPVLGPNALAGMEHALGWLNGMDLTDQERIHVLVIIDGFVSSCVRSMVNAKRAEERTGVTDEEFWTTQAPILEKAMSTGKYPRMAALSEEAFAGSGEVLFEFGLRLMIEGLKVYLDG